MVARRRHEYIVHCRGRARVLPILYTLARSGDGVHVCNDLEESCHFQLLCMPTPSLMHGHVKAVEIFVEALNRKE